MTLDRNVPWAPGCVSKDCCSDWCTLDRLRVTATEVPSWCGDVHVVHDNTATVEFDLSSSKCFRIQFIDTVMKR